MFGRPIHAGAALIIAPLLVAMLASEGCARKSRARVPSPPAPAASGTISAAPDTMPASPGATETGIASWYGKPYDGRRAANGEIYDMEQLTAAHRTLPFETRVEVNNLENGKHVEVRITDRGPFVDGRIIDLSLAAAREIDMVGPGLARVRLRVIELGQPKSVLARSSRPAHSSPPQQPSQQQKQPQSRPASSPAADELYCAQAGAFADRERAESLAESLAGSFTEVRVVSGTAAWRVLVGREETLDTANQLAAKVRAIVGEAAVVKDR
jgi:rare lipoprotein A